MKRSEMVKKLTTYIDSDEEDVYPEKILQFLEDEGMELTEVLQGEYPSAVGWDPEEEPKLPQKGAVKKITAAAKARHNATQAKFKRHRKL